MSHVMLPQGIAAASLDLVNAPQYEHGNSAIYSVPTNGVRKPSRHVQDTVVGAHALAAATRRIDVLGPEAFVLVRLLQSGTELEVRLMGYEMDVPATNFLFAAPLLAEIGIFQDPRTAEIHLLAVTTNGMLSQLQLPLPSLLRGKRMPSGWNREYAIQSLDIDQNNSEATSVHIIDAGLLLIACANGTLIQLRQSFNTDGSQGSWNESILRPASFLSGVSRLFQRGVLASPSRASLRTAATQTLSVASHLRKDGGAALAFCVCRDRKLRVWNLVSESCIRTVDLPLSYSAKGAATDIDERDYDAFEHASAPLIHLYEAGDDSSCELYLVIFVPAPLPHGAFVAAYSVELEDSNSWSGGVGDIALVWGKSCDTRTQAADVELRDMTLTHDGDAMRVWLLWHAGGAPLVQHTSFQLETTTDIVKSSSTVARQGLLPEELWTSIAPYAQYPPLRGPEFDDALANQTSPADLMQFFLKHLCIPGRYSSTTLAAALRTHAKLSETDAKELARPEQHPHLFETLIVKITESSVKDHDAQFGITAMRNAWLRFTRLVEQIDRNARWPLCFYGQNEAKMPRLVMRHCLGDLVAKDTATWLSDLAQKQAYAARYPERSAAQMQGELASADYAFVLHVLSYRGIDHGFSVVRERKLGLLHAMTYAMEFLQNSTDVWTRPIHSIIQDNIQEMFDAVANFVPSAVLDRFNAHIASVTPDVFVQDVLVLSDSLCQPLSTENAPAFDAYSTLLGAEAAAETISSRLIALRALIVLHAVLLRQSHHHPPLNRSLHQAVNAYLHAEALHVLVSVANVPEATTLLDSDALIPLDGLNLGAGRKDIRPAMHLLHAISQNGLVSCGVQHNMLQIAIGCLSREDTCAPLPILFLARDLVQSRFPSAVHKMLAFYTEDAASSYLLALAGTQIGLCQEASLRLARIAAVLCSARTSERDRLLALLPSSVAEASTHASQRISFFMNAAPYWDAAGDLTGALLCYEAALSALTMQPDAIDAVSAQQLYSHVFRTQLALAYYEAAAATLQAIPSEELREVCLHNLVTALCEASALPTLFRLHLGEWQPRVERVLSFKARNAEPLSFPNYFQILYAYHVARGDYKSAAASMYQHARRLRQLALNTSVNDVQHARMILVREAQSDLAAINALNLLPSANAWFAHVLTDDPDHKPAKKADRALQGSITSYLPVNLSHGHAQTLTVVQLADLRVEYNHLLARLELMQLYPELANLSAAFRPEDAVNLFLAADDIDSAFSTAFQLIVDPSNSFDVLTQKCVALHRTHEVIQKQLESDTESPDAALAKLAAEDQEAADINAAFLHRSARAASWTGPNYERAWRYLQLQLAIADAQCNAQPAHYRTAIAERLVALDAWELSPGWLSNWFLQFAPDLLLHVFMRHGAMKAALAYATQIVDRSISITRASNSQPAACIPYTLIDALLDNDPKATDSDPLRQALQRRLHALQPSASNQAEVVIHSV
ncbi:hypothetical protein MYAM1_000396 [Malassezia yamatoensis]|uniref:Nuclear pore complex protein Nup160 n=1 Tax=Malassezia yamatoensis TaxID=253288 RepID=A0AAJ6CEW0_9BASI|nr:hypothetical protein MYAM1_000396 [Malassezia yamatoensis]